MLQPKSFKYRKQHRGRLKGIASKGTKISFGEYGLKAQESSWITARQIEAARRVMTRYTRKGGKIWIRIFPDKPVTARAAETRMGKGKGNVDHYVSPVKKGKVLFEISGIEKDEAKLALNLASDKLPIKTSFLERKLF
ncbi:MAG: 50S ribosomal protein L16 [Chloroflexi bacterium]|jgi:large subunit ribosomal protein L16|nr:50S ribosomal protein L16 [Chloroflexota bacterium]|tara:strand:- start:708 stop:1121 length:414 start_codon:yes stop_codon:yes gene_type:complete